MEQKNVKNSRARAHTQICHKMSHSAPRYFLGVCRSFAHLHKKFNFGLIGVAHLHLLLSVPVFTREKRQKAIITEGKTQLRF